jgi:hypothetical protein
MAHEKYRILIQFQFRNRNGKHCLRRLLVCEYPNKTDVNEEIKLEWAGFMWGEDGTLGWAVPSMALKS